MQRKYLLTTLLLLAVASAPALAEEIVYFTNGSSMPVESYTIEDGTIRLDLGDQAFVAFPVDQIDRIETGDGRVQDTGKTTTRANKIVAGVQTGSLPANRRQVHSASRSTDRPRSDDRKVERDSNGIAVSRPFANHPAPNKRQFTTVAGGNRNPTAGPSEGGVLGASPVGSRYALPNGKEQKHKQPVGLSVMPHKPFTSYRDDGRNDDKKDENE